MQRYTNSPPRFEIRSSASEIEPATQEKPILKRKMLKLHKYTQLNTQTLNTLNSQDDDSPNGNKIAFKLERKRVSKDMPGVGQYDISIPIVKPAYQTYQKSNEVVLVKINHIGGTSSFRSEEDRFNQGGQSIYIPSLTPGPGAYDSLTKRKQKERHSKPYSETYNIIHDMIMQNRQTIESIPNYCLPSKAGLKYNGMPKHLQDMYHKLDRARVLANSYRDTSLQLKDLHKIKQEREAMPMKSVEQPEPFAYWDIEKEKSRTIPRINQKLTETMCRFEQQKKKETERAQKIQAILQYQKKRSFSVERSSEPKQHNQKESRVMKQRYNQNMVNILFGQKNKRQYHKDKHCAL